MVEALVIVDAPQVMHNLTIERVATYAVGSGQWVVHNKDVCKYGVDIVRVEQRPSAGKLQIMHPNLVKARNKRSPFDFNKSNEQAFGWSLLQRIPRLQLFVPSETIKLGDFIAFIKRFGPNPSEVWMLSLKEGAKKQRKKANQLQHHILVQNTFNVSADNLYTYEDSAANLLNNAFNIDVNTLPTSVIK